MMFMVVMRNRFFRHFLPDGNAERAIGMMFMVMTCIAMFVMMVTSVGCLAPMSTRHQGVDVHLAARH